jgi:hypothetical protein
LALPLIALNHHEVKINFKLRNLKDILQLKNGGEQTGINNISIIDARLLVDYVFLENDMRKDVATKEHRFLIEQVQSTGTITVSKNTRSTRFPLNFKHPVKSLYWFFQDGARGSQSNSKEGRRDHGLFGTIKNPAKYMQLKANGAEFTSRFTPTYFSHLQPYYRHSSVPESGQKTSYNYFNFNFCLRPEEHQPTGSMNFSRLDSAYLHVDFNHEENNKEDNLKGKSIDFRCYALNTNIFLVSNGMGGILYK